MSTSTSPGYPAAAPSPPAPRPPVGEALLALVALKLVREYPAWVRRRVETITYVADATVRRHMSVDFVLPFPDDNDPDDPFKLVPQGSLVLVPLWLPPKRPLTNFDARDESGAAMSVLNTRDNGHMAALVLKALVQQHDHQLSESEGADIEYIAERPTAEATERLSTATNWLNHVLAPGSSARAVLDDLVEGYMLLVQIRYAPGQHRVVKWSVDTPHVWDPTTDQQSFRARASRSLRRLGILDRVQAFPPISIGLSESYHMEIVAPEEVLISDAFMSTRRWTPAGISTEPVASVAPQKERAHLNTSVLAERDDAEKARGDEGVVIFTLRARRSATFIGLAVTTLIIATVLTLVASRVVELDGTTAATILVVFPTVAAAYLARPGEHVFATRLLAGVRVTALVCVVCSLLIAAIIAGGLLNDRRTLVKAGSPRCRITASARSTKSTGTPQIATCVPVAPRYENDGPSPVPDAIMWSLVGVAWLSTVLLWFAMPAWLASQDEEAKRRRRENLSNRFLPPGGAPAGGGEDPEPPIAASPVVKFAAWMTAGEGLRPLARTWAVCMAVVLAIVGILELSRS